ncbi:hypothetical protein GCM10009835_25610 [Planosporangium flavigriseum]|uniref:Uncharacterized protein n=1 Tax=Planosporangium flavigriseum TaxID=373681 RepID=A0A8J3PLV6_9ACTN|nr:hypothetical protein Pfl04_06700 [Planosporangium flavigriseum]
MAGYLTAVVLSVLVMTFTIRALRSRRRESALESGKQAARELRRESMRRGKPSQSLDSPIYHSAAEGPITAGDI